MEKESIWLVNRFKLYSIYLISCDCTESTKKTLTEKNVYD